MIAQCAQRLAGRWRTAPPPALEEVAIALSRDEQLRSLDPNEAAARWLEPVGEMKLRRRMPKDALAVGSDTPL